MGTIGSRLLVFERELQKRLTCRRRLRGEFMHVVVHNMLCDISNFPKQLNNSSLQLMAFHISHVSLLIIIVLYFRWGPYQIEVPVHSLNCCSYFIYTCISLHVQGIQDDVLHYLIKECSALPADLKIRIQDYRHCKMEAAAPHQKCWSLMLS